jgi:hypothetical protein
LTARALTLDWQGDAGRGQQVVAVVEHVLVLEAETDAPRLDRPLAKVLRRLKLICQILPEIKGQILPLPKCLILP